MNPQTYFISWLYHINIDLLSNIHHSKKVTVMHGISFEAATAKCLLKTTRSRYISNSFQNNQMKVPCLSRFAHFSLNWKRQKRNILIIRSSLEYFSTARASNMSASECLQMLKGHFPSLDEDLSQYIESKWHS